MAENNRDNRDTRDNQDGRDGRETQQPTTLPKPRDAGREGQLRIARAMQVAGHTHQAVNILNGLLDGYPNDPGARAAAEELVAIARDCERRGYVYVALDMYRRLEHLQ